METKSIKSKTILKKNKAVELNYQILLQSSSPSSVALIQRAEQASGRVLETVNFGRQAKKEQWL